MDDEQRRAGQGAEAGDEPGRWTDLAWPSDGAARSLGDEWDRADPTELSAVADRLNAMGDTAELMGDAAGAQRWRDASAVLRLQAMNLLD